jgi:hypothetical protein
MNCDQIPEGLIIADSEPGRLLGLTSEIFAPKCQLFRRGRCMYIQAIEVHESLRGKGHTRGLFQTLWDLGFTVKVPNPLSRFSRTLTKWGFYKIDEQALTTSEPNLDEVMVKPPPNTSGLDC